MGGKSIPTMLVPLSGYPAKLMVWAWSEVTMNRVSSIRPCSVKISMAFSTARFRAMVSERACFACVKKRIFIIKQCFFF